MKKVQFIIISTILSFGLIISSALLSNAIDKSSNSNNEISVKGVAERRIKADIGIISIVYSARSSQYEEAVKSIDEKRKATVELIETLKIQDNEYRIENLKTKPNYVGNTNEISSYELSQTINVSLKNIENLNETFEKLSELKLKFNNLVVTDPEYYISNIERYKNDLLVDASKNAEYKATEMLKVNNNRIGNLKKIIQGQFEIVDDVDNLENINKAKANQSSKKMRVVVTVIYSIDTIK